MQIVHRKCHRGQRESHLCYSWCFMMVVAETKAAHITWNFQKPTICHVRIGGVVCKLLNLAKNFMFLLHFLDKNSRRWYRFSSGPVPTFAHYQILVLFVFLYLVVSKYQQTFCGAFVIQGLVIFIRGSNSCLQDGFESY